MTTYRAISSSETQPDAPLTSELMIAAANNPVAIAEGATGAPRVVSKALGNLLAGLSEPPFTLTDLDDEDFIGLSAEVTGGTFTGQASAEYALSNDNGSTWGAWVTFTMPLSIVKTFANNAIRFRFVSDATGTPEGVVTVIGLGSVA